MSKAPKKNKIKISELTQQKDFDGLIQIRELLFGSQVYDLNKRIEDLSLALERESNDRGKTIHEQLLKQEQQIKSERERLASVLRTLADELVRDVNT